LPLPAQTSPKILLDEAAIAKSLSRIAHEIVEANPELGRVALVGIHTRGVPLAHRLRRLIHEFTGTELELGSVDIAFYRDDVQVRSGEPPRHPQPLVRATRFDFPLEGRTVVLFDDVH
jgi:pyrimidine operon attenuation protein/uracil phosphoribosyltransferase